jgi:hypothetical protein
MVELCSPLKIKVDFLLQPEKIVLALNLRGKCLGISQNVLFNSSVLPHAALSQLCWICA